MTDHEQLQFRDPAVMPTDGMLEHILAESYAAYEVLQKALLDMDMEQEWQWYTPYKAWFAKGQHFWTTQRGTRKEKTLYWLYVYHGFFSIAVWFKEKNRTELLSANLSEKTKQLIDDAKTMGKMPTFPVVINITAAEHLDEIYALIDWKNGWRDKTSASLWKNAYQETTWFYSGGSCMTKKKKIVLWSVGGLVVLLAAAGLLVSQEVGRQMGEGILYNLDGVDTNGNSIAQLETWEYDLSAFQATWNETAVYVPSEDGVVIPAGVYQPLGKPVGSVILVHGHGGDRVSVAPLADIYLRGGYTVYAMDQRASGESENPLCSFGVLEKKDVEALVDYAKAHAPQLPVVAHGQSMGAATSALYGATDHAADNLDALILDSAYESMEHMVLRSLKMDGVKGWYFSRCADWYFNREYGFIMADGHVVNHASSIQTPTLVIQSARDVMAPVEIGQGIYEAIPNPDKAYWEADSDHIDAAIDFPEEYEAQVMGFLSSALRVEQTS